MFDVGRLLAVATFTNFRLTLVRPDKAVFAVGDVGVSQFSDEITLNCAPPV
jgi:hypothetical protein